MQFDTTSADASAEKLQMLDTFFTLIPDLIIGTLFYNKIDSIFIFLLFAFLASLYFWYGK
jgi:hypothetical protein